MIRVVVGGATGKMGSMVCQLVQRQMDIQLTGGIVSSKGGNAGKVIAPGVLTFGDDGIEEVLENADVYVDVTCATAAKKNLPKVARAGVNAVVGTTGISKDEMDEFVKIVNQHRVSAVATPNFSIGVNVFWKLCGTLAVALPTYDVEIVEIHHRMKQDAPSGTAKRTAEIIAGTTGADEIVYGRQGLVGARGREIGIHSIRAGDVIGEHTVIFAGNKERLELTHRAHSREAFAEGCIAAIRWVAFRKDGFVHTMEEVLGLC
ncbi:MAG: 4-hydroxy-tetrahydrodipicolinate reductase [Methanomassiliicoccales archaeon]|jgi:4-hydroxy-tetrahydrodipicolinate reductase